MKLDYLKDGSDDCPLIRLYEFEGEELRRLRDCFEKLAEGRVACVRLQDVTPIRSVDGTQLTFSRATRDCGVMRHGEHNFDVVLTPDGWQRCSELIGPRCQSSQGYQWLWDDIGGIRILLSHNGAW